MSFLETQVTVRLTVTELVKYAVKDVINESMSAWVDENAMTRGS